MESAWWWWCAPHLASLSLSSHNRGWRRLGGVAWREEDTRVARATKGKRKEPSPTTRKEKGKQQEEERRRGGGKRWHLLFRGAIKNKGLILRVHDTRGGEGCLCAPSLPYCRRRRPRLDPLPPRGKSTLKEREATAGNEGRERRGGEEEEASNFKGCEILSLPSAYKCYSLYRT